MEITIDAQRMLHYDLWANQQVLKTLLVKGTPPKALSIFAHIVAAHRLFLARICEESAPLEVWPKLTLSTIEKELEEVRRRWGDVLNDRDACQDVRYVNSKGEHWKNQIGDIVLHVVAHSAYHRGQIATLMGQSGLTPAYTDYIQATRAGVI
jgi:uncharacterized damage-inducible protein DinB